jgi:membrane protein involved in colicin uptake
MVADQRKIPGDPTLIIAAARAIAQLSHAPRKPPDERIADEEQVIVETLFQLKDQCSFES